MTEQHPITPSTELLDQWCMSSELGNWRDIAICAAQWGADMELEACCEWLEDTDCDDPQDVANHLRAARRPEPPSLKEQALEAARIELVEGGKNAELIIRALEALND
jgi:hypothetical protein